MASLHTRIPHHFHGMVYFVGAMLCFSLMNVLIRYMNDALPSVQLVFLRNIISFVLFLPFIAKQGSENVKTTRLPRHFFRALIGLVAMEAWFYSLTELEVNIATAISFTAPLFTTIFAVIFLAERIGKIRVITLIIGFCGVLVIANPFNGSWDNMMILALFSAAMIAASGVIVKTLTTTEPSWRIVFYMAGFMSILSFPPAYLNWQPLTQHALIVIATIAVLSTMAQFCLAQAFRRSLMVVLMPLDFSRLIFTATLAWIILREPITIETIIGSVIIISSTVYITWREMKRN